MYMQIIGDGHKPLDLEELTDTGRHIARGLCTNLIDELDELDELDDARERAELDKLYA